MKVLIIVLQLVIAVFVTVSVTPAILFAVPAAREAPVGMALAGGVLVVSFVLISLLWPRRKVQ